MSGLSRGTSTGLIATWDESIGAYVISDSPTLIGKAGAPIVLQPVIGNVGVGTGEPQSKLTVADPATEIGTWTSQTSAANNEWESVTFGNGLFVAVSITGGSRCMTSPDGVTWTSRTITSRPYTSVAFGNGVFVAVAFGSSSVETSPDGITWTPRAITSRNYSDITFGDGTFVAIADNPSANCETSTDGGLTWTTRTLPVSKSWSAVTFGNGTFVAVTRSGGADGSAISTDDGVTWTNVGQDLPNQTFRGLTFGSGLFVAVSTDGTDRVQTSPDGITWTGRTAAITLNTWTSVSFGNGIFMSVSGSGTGDRAMSSTDGITWVTEATPADNNWRGITFGDDTFVAVSTSGTNNRAMSVALTNPDTAILDLQSTTSGLLAPRMTEAQRDAIASPPQGLQLYNITTTHTDVFDGTAFREQSQLAVSTFEIFQESDWPNAPVAGVLTIDSGRYIIKDGYVTANRFVFTTGAEIVFEWETLSPLIYVGTGTLFSGSPDITIIHKSLIVLAAPGGQLFDVTGESPITSLFLVSEECNFVAVAPSVTIGSINGFRGGLLRFTIFTGFQEGIAFNDTSVTVDGSVFQMNELGSSAVLSISGSFLAVSLIEVRFQAASAQPLYRIDPAIIANVAVSDNQKSVGGNLFEAGGTTGTFTAVADAAVAATAITSVTDSSGVARFNFTVGPTLFVNQEVVISTFVTNTTYNGTFIITATGAGFFEVALIAFGSDETGSFLSNSVTLTDTSTTLVNGDTLTINTDDSTDYDSGATVYNQLTNSFQINRTFTVTKTGTWSTAGIDQTDPRVLAAENPGFSDSHYIAAAFVNDNSTAVGAITNNTFTDLVFGTGGSALIAATTIERFKLIDELNGTFEYIGNEPFEGSITFDFTVLSTGGTVEFRFQWQKDIGAGFVDLDNPVEALVAVGSDAQSVTKTFPLALNKGDQIKPEITRNTGTSGITVRYATVYASQ